MDDSLLTAVSQVMQDGMSIVGIVLGLIDSEYGFLEIGTIFTRLGHFVALSPNSSEFKGAMLIANQSGTLEIGSGATTITWGGKDGVNEMPFRNHPEEVMVNVLKQKGCSINGIVAKLVEIGLTGSELHALFTRLGYQVHGEGYGELEGWMVIADHGDISGKNYASVYWGETHKAEENLVVSWN